MPKKVFISYDYASEVDRAFKGLLTAWEVGSDIVFLFSDHDGSIAHTSSEAVPIKDKITKMISESNAVVCIMGKNAQKSPWVTWEVMQAVTLRKKVIRINPSQNVKDAFEQIKKELS